MITNKNFPRFTLGKRFISLIRSADDLGDPGPDPIYGAGKLNVISALSPIDGLTR